MRPPNSFFFIGQSTARAVASVRVVLLRTINAQCFPQARPGGPGQSHHTSHSTLCLLEHCVTRAYCTSFLATRCAFRGAHVACHWASRCSGLGARSGTLHKKPGNIHTCTDRTELLSPFVYVWTHALSCEGRVCWTQMETDPA